MKLEIERRRLLIIPENDMEIAYIETVLGLEEGGDYIRLERVNAMGLSCISYLEARQDGNKTDGSSQ